MRKAKAETLSLIQETIDKFRSEAARLQAESDELVIAADRLEGKPASRVVRLSPIKPIKPEDAVIASH